MRAQEFTDGRVMAKIERTGQIVQILRHEDHVKFSDDQGWFLVNTEPGRRTGTGIKWIPDSTRFAWVKKFNSLEEMRAAEFIVEYDLKVSKDSDGVAIKATAGGKQLGHAEFFFDEQGRLDPQTVWVDERFHGQGIAADMYDHLKSLGYTIIRSWDQTDAGRGFWNKHRGPEATVWESQRRLPAAVEEFLDGLNPDDCGVEDIGPYRIHFEGFTSDCKSSADYRRDPEAVYQQVYRDFVQREGGQKPVIQDMAGDEDFPILFSIFRRKKSITENKTATAKQVLAYINQTHHEPFRPGEKMYAAVLAHPQWELRRVPLLNLNIPDQEYDDVDYDDEPESDPYGRVMMVEPGHAGEVSQHLIDKKPIVIDADRYIIDGNHRAWAAKYLLNRDYIMAWAPVEQIREDSQQYLYHATYGPLLKSIRAKGLGNTTQSQWTDSKPGVVYLARDPEVARSYAEAAESVPEAWLDSIVVLKISQTDLDPKRLKIDRNVIDNQGDTIEYHGTIPANLLRRIK